MWLESESGPCFLFAKLTLDTLILCDWRPFSLLSSLTGISLHKYKGSINPCPKFLQEFSATAFCASSVFCWLGLILMSCVGCPCSQETDSKYMADKLSHCSSITQITHSSCSPECSKNAHPLACSIPLVAWLGKLRLLEQTPCRYLACSGSPLGLQTGWQPPRYCKTSKGKTLVAAPQTTSVGLWAITSCVQESCEVTIAKSCKID